MNADDALSAPFDWQDLPSGRARFNGLVRGAEQIGHDSFAVDCNGEELFGGLQRVFLGNGNDFNIEVVAFGYRQASHLGLRDPGDARLFSASGALVLQQVIAELIAAGAGWVQRPRLLVEHPGARFQGQVSFKPGWLGLAEAEGQTRVS